MATSSVAPAELPGADARAQPSTAHKRAVTCKGCCGEDERLRRVAWSTVLPSRVHHLDLRPRCQAMHLPGSCTQLSIAAHLVLLPGRAVMLSS